MLDVNIYLGKANANTPRDKDVGQKAVLKLCEPFFNSNRCVTADNFFTSVVLAQSLWTQNLIYVGTMRTNRNVIPQSFLVNKNRLAESSCFAFCDYLTLTFYVPGLNKVVVLLSTMHHDKKVNSVTNNSEIIMTYNKNKGGVDTFDHMVEINTCRRKNQICPFNVFMFILDCASQNAFSLSLMKKKDEFDFKQQSR